MCVSCGRGKEDEDLMFKSIFRKEILCFGRVWGCNLNCVNACS